MTDVQPTPGQTVGPFFHYALPFPGDRDLVPPGSPGSVRLHGRVLDGDGAGVPDALVEVRQAGPDGVVPRVPGSLRRDGHTFTGWGRATTDRTGEWSFTTLEPGPVAGGPPFFALAVLARGLTHRLLTRAYLPLEPTAYDAVLRAAGERAATLVCRREEPGPTGAPALRLDLRLQGEGETVFLEHAAAADSGP